MNNIKLSLLFIFLFIGCSETPNYNDPELIIKRIRNNYLHGNYEKAFKDVMWIHEHISNFEQPVKSRVFHTKLNYWVKLSDKYPVVVPALRNIRNQNVQKIKKGNKQRGIFQELVYLNKAINDTENTVSIFKLLIEQSPDYANECYYLARDDLIEFKEYAICSQFLKNPLEELKSMKMVLNANIELMKKHDISFEEDFEIFIEKADKVLLILTKTGRTEDAKIFINEAPKGIEIKFIKEGLDNLKHKYLPDHFSV